MAFPSRGGSFFNWGGGGFGEGCRGGGESKGGKNVVVRLIKKNDFL